LARLKKTVKKILADILPYYNAVQGQTNLPRGDFPKPDAFVQTLSKFGNAIKDFPNLDNKKIKALVDGLDASIANDIPALMRQIPGGLGPDAALGKSDREFNPFEAGSDSALIQGAWAVTASFKSKYDATFYACNLVEGKLKGADARDIFIKSRLPNTTLKPIWALADCDADGLLDCDEFAVAMCLIECHSQGLLPEIPENLPLLLVPPSKRELYEMM